MAFASIEEAAGRSRRARAAARTGIRKRFNRSAGYISVACRVGRALNTLPTTELERLRSARLGIKSVQRVLHRRQRDAEIIAALHAIIAAPPGTHRASRKGRGPAPGYSQFAARDTSEWRFTWDDAAARLDPVGYLEDVADVAVAMLEEITSRLYAMAAVPTSAAAGLATVEQGPAAQSRAPLVGQSIQRLLADLERRRQSARRSIDQIRAEHRAKAAAPRSDVNVPRAVTPADHET